MASKSDIRAGRAYVELYLKNSALMKGLKSIRQQAQAISDEFMKMGTTLTKIGVAMAIPIGLATKRFADFDDQMRTVKAVSQASEADFQRLTESAKRLGVELGYTAGEVAAIMTELGRAGFTAEQIEPMTEAVMNLARASGTDAAVAAGIMSATIRQFGLDASHAARVSDVLADAANATFSSVEGLGESLSYAGPVAAALNMSLEDTVAIVGALGNVGIQGSEAGTALRRLSVIAAGSGEELQAIFGISNTDADGNLKPLIDILDEINTATADMSVAERTSKMEEAFGILGITSATALSQTAGGVRALAADLKNANGVAADTAKQMNAGMGGALRKLWAQIDLVAIAIGDALAPVILQFTDWIKPAVKIIEQFIAKNKAVIQVAVGVVAGIIAAGGALMTIGAIFGMISFAAGGIVTAITAVTTTIGMIGAVLASPFLVLTGLILGLGAVIVGIAAYWLFFTDEGKRALKAVMSYFQPLIDFFAKLFGGIKNALQAGEFGLAFQIAVEGMKVLFFSAIDAIVKHIMFIPRALLDALQPIANLDRTGWLQEKLLKGHAVLTGVDGLTSSAAAAARQQLEDLMVVAEMDADVARQKAKPKADKAKPGEPKPPGAPGGPKPEDLSKLKTIGSFNATELVMQNWGVIQAPKVDKQAEMLKKLDEIYKANVGVVPAVRRVEDAVKDSNKAFEPIP